MPQNPGLSPAVQQAMQRRSGSPALSQVSPQAPMANPVPEPANPSSLNQTSAPPSEQAPKLPKFEPQNRKDLIVTALVEQLENENKLEKEQMKMAQQPAPEPAPMQAPVGGGATQLSPGFNQPMAKSSMQSDYGFGNYSGLTGYGNGNF